MQITLARIDDRLIHGQVTTVWSKVANARRIIICNDEVYNDEVRRTLLRQAAPPGMKVNAVVKLPLPCKRVFPIAVGRIDFDRRERIAYAEIACYLLFLFGVRT